MLLSVAAALPGRQAHDDCAWWTLATAKGYLAPHTHFGVAALLSVTLIRYTSWGAPSWGIAQSHGAPPEVYRMRVTERRAATPKCVCGARYPLAVANVHHAQSS